MFSSSGTSTLKIGVDNAINAASSLSVISVAVATAPMVLDLNGRVLALRSLSTANNHGSGAFLSVLNNVSGVTSVLTLSDATAANIAIFTGALKDGQGPLALVKAGASTQVLLGNNTYTGTTTINSGTLQVGGATGTYGSTGYLASPSIIMNGGSFIIDNVGASNSSNNRLSDTSDFTFNGGAFIYKGSDQASTNSSETIRNISINSGFKTFTVTYGGSNTATINASQITRAAQGGILLVNGTNLGATGTASVSRVYLSTLPTLIGAGLGTTDAKIIPYLLGESIVTAGGSGTQTGTANTFLTYDASTGLRPLNPSTEFTLNAFTAGQNVRLTTGTTTASSTVAINSLILDGGTAAIASGQTLTVSSGAILFASGTNTGVSGGTLAFGAQEGIVTINAVGNTIISSVITGTAGVSYYGSGTLVLGTQQNSYTGDTRLEVALVIPQSSSQGPAGAPDSGPFGKGTVIFAGSAIRATIANPITIGNNISFAADTTVATSGTLSSDRTLTFTGAVSLTGGNRVLTQNSGAATTFTGNIGDGGNNYGLTVNGNGTGAVVTSGANTYGGATNVAGTSTLIVNGSHVGGGSYSVSSGATLAGGGAITTKAGSSVNIGAGGILSVGDGTSAAADLTITTSGGGSLSFTSSSILRLDIFGDASPGLGTDQVADPTRADKLIVTGDINLNGARLVVGDPNGVASTFSKGDTWDLFDWISAFPLGSFTINPTTDLPTLSSGLFWDTSDLLVGGTISVVPEPSRMFLLMLGLTGLFLRRRRR